MNSDLITPGVMNSIQGGVIQSVATGEYADKRLLEAIVAYSATAFGGKPGKVTDEIPEEIKFFVDKVIHESHKILDRDFETLNAAGYSDDEATDIALAAAGGAAYGRLQMALAAMDKEM